MNEKLQTFLIKGDISIKKAMQSMTTVGQKELFIVDEANKLLGALSDGDIRKWILREGNLEERVDRICNHQPKFFKEDFEIDDVKKLMLDLKIESVPIIKENNEITKVLVWDDIFSENDHRHRESIDASVVIMAGGKGTRLDPFTKILPKPLIPIGDKPIIEIIIDHFYNYNINDFHILINHKARMIKSFFEDKDAPYNLHYTEEDSPLGTAGGLKLLENKLKGTFFVTNSDIIIESDYSELFDFHKNKGYDLTLVVSYRHHVIPYGVCQIENGGILKSIDEKPSYDLLVNTGMYVLNHRILKCIPENQPFDMPDLIEEAKNHNYKIGVFPINEKSWIDVGQWEEYHKAIDKLKAK